MHPMLNIAIRAARKAGNHIAKSLENTDKVESTLKGTNDFVTNVDKEAEYIIIDTIKQSYPEHCIVLTQSTASLLKNKVLSKVKIKTYNGSSTHWMALLTL